MTWRIEWLEPAIQALQRIPWRDAARVDAAVQRFAATGKGDVVRLLTDDATTLRIRVAPYAARVTLDQTDSIIYVWIVYRLR